MSGDTTSGTARQRNPIVTAAAEQVAKSKRRRTSKARDLPRWECPDQMTLFDHSSSEADQ
ncbi:hypothetical protein [Nocardia pneumoniae]|uniref:hypothetical protein n=1 Tax=Nocardia pneumoniae TaxID=228601 RepID=UPI0002D8E5F2|nr:hypothetical protein [Nocardia pneumoniae]